MQRGISRENYRGRIIITIEQGRWIQKLAPATQVIFGKTNAISTELGIFKRANKRIDTCMTYTRPSLAVSIKQIRDAFLSAKRRGVRLRYITEINHQNFEDCKVLLGIVDELRHLDGVKTNFMISEVEYLAPLIQEKSEAIALEHIYSDTVQIVEHGRCIFDTLWSKSISAEERIRQLQEDVIPQETRILDNQDEIIKQMIHLSEISSGLSVVSNHGGLQLTYNSFLQQCKNVLEKQKRGEGEGIRWIMGIEKDSVKLVKKFLKLGVKIRHVKNLAPINFAVSKSGLVATVEEMKRGGMIQNLLTSNERSYIKHFTSMFEQLWKEGVDARYRIKDIEEKVGIAEIEIIRNPVDSIARGWDMVRSARKEIDVLFSSSNALKRQITMGALALLKNASEKQKVKIRMLLPSSDESEELIEQTKSNVPKINIRTISASLETKISILVVDSRQCLILELKDDKQNSSYEAVGLSTYSISPTIISSYLAVFESFWRQAELFERMKEVELLEKDFVNIAAHELRNPIQPIIGFSELLYSKIDNQEHRRLLDEVILNAKRLERLARLMLDVTRIENNSLVLTREAVDASRILKDIVESYNHKLEEKNAEINNENTKLTIIQKGIKNINASIDRVRITQVFCNILDNAVSFSHEGKIHVISKVEKQSGQHFLIISVKDTGPGIDPEILPKLFTKFASKSDIGTGLGLFISKGIVEAHGGKIWAENNPDRGATFSFSLPINN
ncbi:MAG: HAMP domain-containing sensor histidine kinase [Nitrososphaeraceae archaeon]|nr:HAMP domain-containing sensor histidine kinase [Nitrososphaeraceae archaeon]